ncbi:MAG: hypothetical protein HRU19_16555 [Pseudobacteriovorax sp.]|nr:hypothetical protein [Pseudobacteriovorax sp.]
MKSLFSTVILTIVSSLASISIAETQTLSRYVEHPKFNTRIQAEVKIDEANHRASLKVEYRSDLDYCYYGGDQSPPDLHIQFQLGEGEDSLFYTYPMAIGGFCSQDKRAVLTMDSISGFRRMFQHWDNDPLAWEKVFPLSTEGFRWYAMKVSFMRSQQGTGIVTDEGDSQGYEIVFE